MKFLSIKCVLLVVLFMYCIYYYTVIDTMNPSSPFYVADRIFYFSMVVSSIMFVSLIIGLIILVYLKHKKQRNNTITTFKGNVRHAINVICMYRIYTLHCTLSIPVLCLQYIQNVPYQIRLSASVNAKIRK